MDSRDVHNGSSSLSDMEGTHSVTMRAASLALIAVIAFGAGIFVGEQSQGATRIVSNLPFIGDGLDATPSIDADLTDFWKAWNTLERNYVLTSASSTLPSVEDRMFGAIKGLAQSYNDPYTLFFPPKEAKEFAESISGSFAGVGMEIAVKENVLTVVTPLRGTPAEAAGIQSGDKIVAIDGKTTDGLAVEAAVRKIRGPAGTEVHFTLIRGGKTIEVTVTRAIIDVPETKDALDELSGVYSIALYEFTANSPRLFNQAFARFKSSGSRKLIIDLRGNPGGYLDAAVDIVSHFMPRGAVVVTEDFGGRESNRVHTSLGYMDVPKGTKIVVLIDGGSASASEIVAGALQDSGVATIIGMPSFGKGSVQTLMDLGKGSLKITVARWVTPGGTWIMGNGIKPNIEVPFTATDAVSKKDPQMERAVLFLTNGK